MQGIDLIVVVMNVGCFIFGYLSATLFSKFEDNFDKVDE